MSRIGSKCITFLHIHQTKGHSFKTAVSNLVTIRIATAFKSIKVF